MRGITGKSRAYNVLVYNWHACTEEHHSDTERCLECRLKQEAYIDFISHSKRHNNRGRNHLHACMHGAVGMRDQTSSIFLLLGWFLGRYLHLQ